MSLTPEEVSQLSLLMNKIEFPIPQEVFNAWCENFTVSCAELAVIRKNKETKKQEVFLIYRKDKFFDGWHIPGSIILPGKTVKDTLEKVIKNELAGMDITEPKFLSWFERVKGRDKGLRGQELSVFHIASTDSVDGETETAKFFALDNIPENLIHQHVELTDCLKNYINNKI